VPATLLGGWLLARNWLLYGDVTAANQFVRIAGGDRGYTLGEVLAESSGLWTSFFALFGWFNVRAPEWVYGVWNGLVLLAGAGALVRAARDARRGRHGPTIALWLALWVLLVYAGLVSFMLRTPAAQGRLLFPALLPLALGVAYGLDWGRLPLLASLLALLTSLYCLVWVLPVAYERPPDISVSAIPAEATLLQTDLGQGVELVASRIDSSAARPGETVWLTLFWRVRPVPPTAPEMVVELFGPELVLAGKLHSYHGGGLYPANLWPAGAIVVDRVGVRLLETVEGPATVWVQVGLAGEVERVTIGTVSVPAPLASGAHKLKIVLHDGMIFPR
jgi:hypothetical protein